MDIFEYLILVLVLLSIMLIFSFVYLSRFLLKLLFCFVALRFAWKLLSKSNLLICDRLHHLASLILSILLIASVLFGEGNSYSSIVVCLTFFNWYLCCSCSCKIEIKFDVFKRRYITSLIFFNTVLVACFYPLTSTVIAVVLCGIPSDTILEKTQYFASILLKTPLCAFLISALVLHIYIFNLKCIEFVLLDLVLYVLLSTLDAITSNLTVIRLSIMSDFEIKKADLKILINEWESSRLSEKYGKLLQKLYESDKLSKQHIHEIIDIGLSIKIKSQMLPDSFIAILLPEIENESVGNGVKTRRIIEIKNNLLKEYNIKNLNVVNLVNLSNVTHERNDYVLHQSFMIFQDPKRKLNERLYASNAMIKQLTFHSTYPTYVDTFVKIALKPKKQFTRKELLLSCIAFQSLNIIKSIQPLKFFEEYYTINILPNLGNSTGIKATEENKLNTRVLDQNLAYNERYLLLETMSVILFNGYQINTSVFTNFQAKDWLRELLVYVLLGKCLEVNGGGWEETKIKEFIEHVRLFCESLYQVNDELSNANIVKALKSLINYQHKHKFDLSQTIDILILLRTRDVTVKGFFNNEDFIKTLLVTEYKWLETICVDKQIILPNKDSYETKVLIHLHKLLAAFEISTINNIFYKLEDKSSITDLLSFFHLLNSSQLTVFNKHVFLKRLHPGSAYAWKCEISKLIVSLMINNEFSNYISGVTSASDILIKNDTILKKIKNKFSNIFVSKEEEMQETFAVFSKDKKVILNDQLNGKNYLSLRIIASLRQVEMKLCELLCLGKWTIGHSAFIIQSLDTVEKVEELERTLYIITDYNLNEDEELSKIFINSATKDLTANVLRFAIRKSFLGTYDKLPDELLNEIQHLNKNNNIEFIKNLSQGFQKVCKADYSSLVTLKSPIKNWTKGDIVTWITKLKQEDIKNNVSETEKISVLIRALELTSKTKIKLRNVQVMSLLLLLNPSKGKGRLVQINTGEGKTNIIAIVAAYHGLHGHQVDIVTTSPVLAVPQCNLLEPFYTLLGLTVSHNFDNPDGYHANIVYGPVLDFEADVLRDECIKNGRRRGRKYDVVIVDEVDSMFIDGNDHIVMLSTDMPGMNHLETLLAAIALQIDNVASCIKYIGGKAHFMQLKGRINKDGTLTSEEEYDAFPLECTVQKFIHDSTEKHIRKLVRDEEAENGYPQIQVPNHLKEFVFKVQIPKWIDSAIRAKHVYEDTKHYVIRKGKVMPVDAQNTGVVHENQHWNDGLHQFIQFKHGAKVYPESLTNNYISNVGFFRRYGHQIYGLTGTLGNETSAQFLEKVYQVDTVIIPPFRKKQHLELVPKILNTEDDWYTEITRSAISMLNSGRAVLVITKFIKEIDDIHEKFKRFNYDVSKILLFKTNEDAHVVNKIIQPGEVVLTTNIAGRGTDIQLHPSVDDKGGLHVCLTFLPGNTRVEMQNVGRTSRTGNRGTSQLMLLNKGEKNIINLLNERDVIQKKAISKCEEDVEVVLTKEAIFAEFLHLLDQIQGREKEIQPIEKKAVEERFAIWLKIEAKFIKNEPRDKVLKHFRKFKEEIIGNDHQDELIKNPYFYVILGNAYLKTKQYNLAINQYSLAIKLDQNFAENAYYNRAFCLLAEHGKNMSGNKYYIDDAISDLKKARKLLQNREADLHLLQRASDAESFSEQIQHKMNLYNSQKQVIDVAIGPDKDNIDSQLTTLEKRLKENPSTEEKKEINDLIKTLKEERKRDGIIDQARKNNRNLETKLLELSEFLPESDIKTYEEEVDEFERNGFIGGFKITEIKPIDWKSVFGLMVLGLGQLIAGAALAVYTLGSGVTFAMNLISEGISDIITAIKDGIINRDFSWASWAVQKAISITIAVVCAGMSAMKDVAKTCSSGASKLIGKKVLDETVKSGWKLVAKKVGTELAKGVIKEVVTDLANYGLEKTLLTEIQVKLLELTERPIQEALMNSSSIEMLLRMDIYNKNNKYETFIKSYAFEILDTSCKNQLLNIAKQIGIGIADGKFKYVAAARKVGEAVYALNELRTLVPNFLKELEEKMEKEVDSESIKKKLQKIESESKPHSEDNTNSGNYKSTSHSETQRESSDIESHNESDIDLKTDIVQQVKLNKPKTDVSRLSKVLTNSVNTKILSTIKGKLVNPVVQAGVNYSVQKLTSSLDKTLNHDIENYKSLKRVIHSQNKGFIKPITKISNTDVDEHDPSVKYVRKLIKTAEDGGNSGLQDMGGISDQTGRPIEVYDEKGRIKFTIGEKNGGEPIKVQHHANSEHYTMLGAKEPKAHGKGKNMCLYNVISEQTGVDPDKLKANNIIWMKANINEYSKQSSDIARLNMYDDLKLCMGGAKYDPKLGAKHYLDNSQGKVAEYKPTKTKRKGNPPPGHPRGHASNPTATEPESSVEQYSGKDKNKPKKDVEKTAFASYEAQDYVAEIAMSHPETAKKIELLNQGSYREEITLTKDQLNLQKAELSKAGKWKNGANIENYDVKDVRLVLGHHEGKFKDPDAPVFITTFFPLVNQDDNLEMNPDPLKTAEDQPK